MSAEQLLVIDRRGCELSYREGRVLVRRDNEPLRSVPITALGSVVLHGEVGLSSGLLRRLADHGVATTLLAGRGQQQTTAVLAGTHHGSAQARLAQYQAYLDPTQRLAIASELVGQKLAAQRQHLLARGLPTPSALSDHTANADSTAALMGQEGAAAAAYFKQLATVIDEQWQFSGRNRRPPRDPLNALLSLAYTLLGNDMQQAIQHQGLDSGLGFLHDIYPNRPALALDLIEALRPRVDEWAISLLDDGLAPDDFHHHADTGCRLNKSARGLFFAAWAALRAGDSDQQTGLNALCRQHAAGLKQRLLADEQAT